MNSQVTIIDPIRGNIHQTIDPSNPPTVADVARSIGGAFAQTGATFSISTGNGPETVNNSHTLSVGETLTVSHNVKAGR